MLEYKRLLQQYFEKCEEEGEISLEEMEDFVEELDCDYDLFELIYQLTAYEGDFDKGLENLVIKESLDDKDTNELIRMYNEFCYDTDHYDREIFVNDEDFLEENFSTKAEAVRAAFYGKYRYSDDYVMFDGYANLKSMSSTEVEEEIKTDSDFISHLLDEMDIDEDFKECLAKATMYLVERGY